VTESLTVPAPDTIRLIESQADFDALLGELATARLVAVDTEAASFHRYIDRIYLIQISTRDLTAVVDPLAVKDLSALGTLLADPKVEILFHDADYDLRLFDREYGFHATRLFDTRIAAQLLNEPGVGLAALLDKYIGIQLDKRFQRADWSARPLSPAMLAYASMDTMHLPALRDILARLLEERGRLSWAEEEFELLDATRWNQSTETEPAFLKMKGAKALKGRELAILREIFQWREGLAKRLDKAAFRILNNEPLLTIAQYPPTDIEQLKAVKGVSMDLADRRGKDVLRAIEKAQALPESKWPRVDRPARRTPDPAFEARLERLKSARNKLAAKFDLAPGVLCPNGTLEAIARLNPVTADALDQVGELRRWQRREFGAELFQALQP
jgi:ribonuclease D